MEQQQKPSEGTNVSASVCELWKKSRLSVTDEFDQPPIVLKIDDSIIGTLLST